LRLVRLSFAAMVAGVVGLALLIGAAVVSLDRMQQSRAQLSELLQLQKRLDDFSAASDSILVNGADPGLWRAYRQQAQALQARLERLGRDHPQARQSARRVEHIVEAIRDARARAGRAGAIGPSASGPLASGVAMPLSSRLVLSHVAGDRMALDHTVSALLSARRREISRATVWATAGFAAAALLFAGLATAALGVIHRRVSEPTRALLDTIDRLRAGDAGARAPVMGRDELAELSGAFNRMLDRQQAAETRLREQRTELEEREWMLRESQRIARVGTWRLHLPDQRFEWSEETYRILGVSPRRYRPTPGGMLDFVHADDRRRFLREAAPEPDGQRPHDLEYRIVRADGEVRHVHERGEYERDANGRAVALIGTVQDVTERRQLDERLREYRQLVEGSEDLCAVVDSGYRFRLVNRAYADRHQLEPGQIEVAHVRDILGEEYFETVVRPHVERCFAGETQIYETERNYPGIGPRQLLVRYYPIAAEGGELQLAACVLTDITEIRQAQAELGRQRQLLDVAGRAARLGGWALDLERDRMSLSDTVAEMLAMDPEEEPGMEEVLRRIAPEDRERVRRLLSAAAEGELAEGEVARDVEARVVNDRGEEVWVIGTVEPARDDRGRITALQGAVQDVSTRKASEHEARRLEARLSGVLANIAEAFFAVDGDWRIRYVNPAGEELAQRSADELVGADTWEAFPEAAGTRVEEQYRKAMAEGVTASLEEYDPKLGKWLQIQAHPADDGLAIFCRDITERKHAERRLERLAYEDQLTGIRSREGFIQALTRHIEEAGWDPGGQVIVIDVDGQRAVNDSQGYSAGDAMLVELARRLRREAGQGGIVGRIGGDEFVAFLAEEVDRSGEAQRSAIAEAFEEPIDLGHASVTVGIFGGYTELGDRPRAAEDLLHEAELAMYENRSGADQGSWTVYTQERAEAMRERIALTRDLREAIAADQLRLLFQPKIELDSGRVVGCEALLRWHHPERGTVSPADFIPVAEQSQLIVPIGEWVLREACRRARAWQDDGLEPIHVAVNVSRAQFQSGDFPATVRAALADYGVTPDALTLEVTESVFEREGDSLRRQLRELHDMGLRLSLDDFGTGYSSLMYLQAYPFDEIKIDKGFVQRVMDEPYSEQVVATVLRIADVLGVAVVSEGVETAEMRDALLKMGSRTGQGFYYSKPLEGEAFAEILAHQPRLPSDSVAQG